MTRMMAPRASATSRPSRRNCCRAIPMRVPPSASSTIADRSSSARSTSGVSSSRVTRASRVPNVKASARSVPRTTSWAKRRRSARAAIRTRRSTAARGALAADADARRGAPRRPCGLLREARAGDRCSGRGARHGAPCGRDRQRGRHRLADLAQDFALAGRGSREPAHAHTLQRARVQARTLARLQGARLALLAAPSVRRSRPRPRPSVRPTPQAAADRRGRRRRRPCRRRRSPPRR